MKTFLKIRFNRGYPYVSWFQESDIRSLLSSSISIKFNKTKFDEWSRLISVPILSSKKFRDRYIRRQKGITEYTSRTWELDSSMNSSTVSNKNQWQECELYGEHYSVGSGKECRTIIPMRMLNTGRDFQFRRLMLAVDMKCVCCDKQNEEYYEGEIRFFHGAYDRLEYFCDDCSKKVNFLYDESKIVEIMKLRLANGLIGDNIKDLKLAIKKKNYKKNG